MILIEGAVAVLNRNSWHIHRSLRRGASTKKPAEMKILGRPYKSVHFQVLFMLVESGHSAL